jgi:leucyl-tRNA---protein transferase
MDADRSAAYHPLMESYTGPCPYLEGRTSRLEMLSVALDEKRYGVLLKDGWRRSGILCYRNACEGCALCIPLRRPASPAALASAGAEAQSPAPAEAPVSAGTARRNRRLARLNQDIEVTLRETCLDEERFSLYRKYMSLRHGQAEDLAETYLALIASPLSRFVDYRLGSGRLVALGFVDVADKALSSAYFAFDPEVSKRSLGSFSVFVETSLARALGKDYYYLGYWVPGSRKMKYKADFPPFEILLPADGGPAVSASRGEPCNLRRWEVFCSSEAAESALDLRACR